MIMAFGLSASTQDYDGNTQIAYLEPGDLLLYESAKNFHGRPIKFDGSW